MVRAAKAVLRKTLQVPKLNYKELQTMLLEVEKFLVIAPESTTIRTMKELA